LFLKIFIVSFILGTALGLLCAFTLKTLNLKHHSGNLYLEACLTAVFPWAAYFLGEGLGLSGIVAILFAGITMAHYTRDLLSEDAMSLTKDMYKVLAKIAESFVFIYLGMSIFSFKNLTQTDHSLVMLHEMKIRLVLVGIFACLVARLFNILPCSLMVNCRRTGPPATLPKISGGYQFLMWWSGLRGGVAFAIAVANFTDKEFEENDEGLSILQVTLWIAVFTIFVFGGGITHLARYFKVIGEDHSVGPVHVKPGRLHAADTKMQKFFTAKRGHVQLADGEEAL
jgi:NhaP-type Na+/H+ or K+/H+ antiporter